MASDPSQATTTPPQKDHRLSRLAVKLFVAWGCGVLWGTGILFVVVAMLAAAIVGMLNFFGPPSWSARLLFILGLGAVMQVSGPALMGAFLARSWRRGVISGLLAFLVGMVAQWAGGMTGLLYYLVPNWPRALDHSVLEPSIGGAATIATIVLVNNKALPHRGLGLSVGLTIGLVLSVVSGLALGRGIFAGNVGFLHFTWQIPPLVWVSAVYFPELLAGRSGWKGFIVWALLILATFGLPFIVVPVLERVFG